MGAEDVGDDATSPFYSTPLDPQACRSLYCQDGYKRKAAELRDRPFIFWRWETEEWIDLDQEDYEKVSGEKAQAPELVRPVDRLRSDIEALNDLTQTEEPVLSKVRVSTFVSALYLVGDTYGKGFSSAMWDRDGIFWESGHYDSAHQDGRRSTKECGIDGLSRGDVLEGMMKSGVDPLVFLPLAQSANDRVDGQVRDWVDTWWKSGSGEAWCGADLTLLSPDDWFNLKNDPSKAVDPSSSCHRSSHCIRIIP
jgi:hypothetical protein